MIVYQQIESTVEKMRNEANSNNYGEGIVVDGYFGDWNNIDKIADYINSAESEHITLQEYAAVEDNANYFMYMNVKGNILNGISIPSYSAKSMPDLKTGTARTPVGIFQYGRADNCVAHTAPPSPRKSPTPIWVLSRRRFLRCPLLSIHACTIR